MKMKRGREEEEKERGKEQWVDAIYNVTLS